VSALRDEGIGRYELLIELGRGGMAELFLGRLHGVGGFTKLVAIKRILPHLAQDPQFKELFLNEGRIAAQLSHPNVCQVFELDEHNGELYLAMEYLDGVSWDHLIAVTPRGAPALRLTAGVLAQAAEGLHYAHGLHVVHRDVSPQNLFVTVDGICKVLDFGVSKVMTEGPRTRTGVIKGKLPYMSPEQIRGEPLDPRADVFSLGVCAWEALAGTRLFDRGTDFQIWKAVTEENVPSIAAHWRECPPAIDAVIRRALERDRDRRQPSARQFADELRAAAGAAAAPPEIAHMVRTSCADRLAARAHQVATVVADRNAGSTIEDRASIQLRKQSLIVDRDAASTVDAVPRAKPRSQLWVVIVVAVLAAGLAATIVAIVMSRGSAERVAAPATPDAAREEGSDWGVGSSLDYANDQIRKAQEELRRAGIQVK